MILSNIELQKALDERRIVIEPEPNPRRPEVGGGHCPYDTHSVDLTLSPEISIPKERRLSVLDLTKSGSIAEEIEANSEKLIIRVDQPYVLEPNKFILAKTAERIHLPIVPGCDVCLAARIEGKSSRARFGVLIHFTAPTVHPGFNGTLTLEMINLGPDSVLLKPGLPVAQLLVEEVKGCPFWNPSQFQGQNSAAGMASNSGP
jgi:dCTP deaminase